MVPRLPPPSDSGAADGRAGRGAIRRLTSPTLSPPLGLTPPFALHPDIVGPVQAVDRVGAGGGRPCQRKSAGNVRACPGPDARVSKRTVTTPCPAPCTQPCPNSRCVTSSPTRHSAGVLTRREHCLGRGLDRAGAPRSGSHVNSSSSGNNDSWRTSLSPENPTPRRRMGTIGQRVQQQPPRQRDQRPRLRSWRRATSPTGQRAHVGLLQLHRDRARTAAVAQQALVSVLGDRIDRRMQLPRGLVRSAAKVDSALICLASARSATGRSSIPPGQPVQRGPDRRTQDVGHLGVGPARRAGRCVDARVDSAFPPRRVRCPTAGGPAIPPSSDWLLRAQAPPDAVRLGQPRRDLGDLLARARADRGDQAGLVAHPAPQALAERLDVDAPTPRTAATAPQSPRRRKVAGSRHHGSGWCRRLVGWLPRTPRRAVAAPPPSRRLSGGPGASAWPSARRTPAPRSLPQPPRRVRPNRRPAPAGRAGWAG